MPTADLDTRQPPMPPAHGFGGEAAWQQAPDDVLGSSQINSSAVLYLNQAVTNSSADQIITELRFAAAKSIRTSTIILAVSNIIAAFATAMNILHDAYSREKATNRNYRFRQKGFPIPAHDTFPLMTSLGIMVQGIVFAVAQSTGLNAQVGLGCTVTGEVMLPALFLVPYMQLVFGLEMLVRTMRRPPLQPRPNWVLTCGLTLVGVMVLASFLWAKMDQASDFCVTSLFWFVAHWSVGCFGLLTATAAVLLVCAVSIFFSPHHTSKADDCGRVTASRMVYYLVLAVISNGFMIPFFYTLAFGEDGAGNSNALNVSNLVASVVANLTGLMTGALYMFLKSSSLSSIVSKDKQDEDDQARRKVELQNGQADKDDDEDDRAMQTVSGFAGGRVDLGVNPKGNDDGAGRSSAPPRPDRPQTNAADEVHPVPRPPVAAHTSVAPTTSLKRRPSYTLFPNQAKSSQMLLPATTYQPHAQAAAASVLDDLKPPPSMATLTGSRHRRGSSAVTSATVQIGIRISSVEDTCPQKPRQITDASTFDEVILLKDLAVAPQPAKHPGLSQVDTALQSQFDNGSDLDDFLVSPAESHLPKPLYPFQETRPCSSDDENESNDEGDDKSVYDSEKAGKQLMQSLQVLTLSPKVYSLNKPGNAKLVSPMGVGFTTPVRQQSSAGTGASSNAASFRIRSPAFGKQQWI